MGIGKEGAEVLKCLNFELISPLLHPLTLPQWQQRYQRLKTGIRQSG
jgi:hypothetical protein